MLNEDQPTGETNPVITEVSTAELSTQINQGSPESASPSSEQPTPPPPSRDDGASATEPQVDTKPDAGKTIGDALAAFNKEGVNGVKFAEKKPDPAAKPPEQLQLFKENGKRDYSGVDDDDRNLFRDMSAASFQKLKPLYIDYKKIQAENEQLKKGSAESAKQTFFEHPDSYQLTGEFRHNSTNLKLIDAETSHWKSQLAAIRNGQKWTALVGYNPDGSPKFAADQEPTAEAEADIIEAMLNARQIRGQLTTKLDDIKTNFSAQHKSYLNNMTAIEKSIFKDSDREVLTKAMERKLPIFPEYLRAKPEIQTIAKLLAVIDGYSLMLEDRKANNVTAEAKLRTATNGGGGMSNTAAAPSRGQSAQSIIDQFAKAKQAGVF